MANTLATCTIIAKMALPILENMLGFSMAVNRDYQDEYGSNLSRGYAPGQTINIKRPPRYTYRAGPVAVPQSTIETTVPLTLSQGGCDIDFSSQEMTVSVVGLENKVQAAVATVANEIDRQGCALAHYATFNTLNTAGALPTTQQGAVSALTDSGRRLDEMGAPRDKQRAFILGPALNGALINGFSGMFNNSTQINKQYGSGLMDNAYGIDPSLDQNVDTHTNGAATATNISAAGQTGASIAVAAVTGGTLTRGTTITLPGVFAVNPQSRTSTNVLANFVVTADVALGATAIPVSPALVTSGPFQNVSASPTNGQPYVILGAASTSYMCNVAFHRDAFSLACVPMWMPQGGKGVIDVAQESNNGFTIKVTRFYDGINDNAITRLDVLFGWVATYPELSVKYYNV